MFTLRNPDAAFPSKVAFASFEILSKKQLNAAGGDWAKISAKPVGTVPYMVKEWVRGDHLTLTANPNYWGDKPKAQTVVFRWSKEAAQRLLELQSGTVDGIDNPAPEDFANLQKDTSEALRRLRRHRSAQVGFVLLVILVLTAIFAPVIAPYDPLQVLRGVTRRSGPCIHLLGCPADQPQHILGIDGNSRDLFSRIVYGSRLSLQIGFATTIFAILLGTLLGAPAGFGGGLLLLVHVPLLP